MRAPRQVFIVVSWLAGGLIAACDGAPNAAAFDIVKTWDLPDALAAVDVSSDGQALLLGSRTGESSMWTAPWNLSVVFDRVEEPLLTARFTSDAHLLFARARGSIEIRESSGAITGESRILLPDEGVRAAASPSGRFVAFDAAVYEVESERKVTSADLPGVSGQAFAEDRLALVTNRDDSDAVVLALDGREPRRWRTKQAPTSAALSRDGRYSAVGTTAGFVIWEDDRPEPICELSASAPVSALGFSASGRWLALVSGALLRVIDVRTCEALDAVPLMAAASALSIDDDLIAVGDVRGNVYLWNAYFRRMARRSAEFSASVAHVRVHAASRSVLAGANEGTGAKAKLLSAAGR